MKCSKLNRSAQSEMKEGNERPNEKMRIGIRNLIVLLKST